MSSQLKRIWDLLNSSFGIFVLSSIVLGSLSFTYGQWRDHRSRRQKMEQLDIEVALRLQAMDKMCSGPDNVYYSNLVNANKVIDGDPKSSFYVHKPVFSEFQNKSITSLLWQLYLVAPDESRNEIKSSIREATIVVDEIRQVRYSRVKEYHDLQRTNPKTKRQDEPEDEQNDQSDRFRKDYGQAAIYSRIHLLAQNPRWKNLVF
jgi:hypothetical protein